MKKLLAATILSVSISLAAQAENKGVDLNKYATLVYKNYSTAYSDAVELQKSVDALVASPTEENLAAAKTSWIKSRESYSPTEAYRFYEGPIDASEANIEGELNSWPLNEAYIDSIVGGKEKITAESLAKNNQLNDESDVSTGYHAIEYLLWGKDLSLESAGKRPATYFAENANAKAYLKQVTDLLVTDLEKVKVQWEPNKDNYAKKFIAGGNESATGAFSALATLSGFELASERMGTGLDSGDQEDEQSCFSDNTHRDFIRDQDGIAEVYFTVYADAVKANNPALATEIENQVKATTAAVAAIPAPIDNILASKKGSESRDKMEAAVTALQKQAVLFEKAGKELGLEVKIMSE
jgi:putative iron-regulated protein